MNRVARTSIFAVHPEGDLAPARPLPAVSARAWLLGGLLAAMIALAISFGSVWSAHAAAPAILQPVVLSKGVVAAIRELPSDDDGARRFEMTIRMRDGTMRVSNETGGARWRAGDKVFLIGMPATP